MTKPSQDNPNYPSQGMVPTTYPEFLQKLECTCPAGAKIKPSPLPSATKNIGDVIADHARILSSFASAYGMITVVIRMIACIIDVLCCITNPFCLISALIRLFGTCLPDFILLFPQLAVPAIIICIIKIVLAIVEYLLTVIVPLIEEIVENIDLLINAFKDANTDAQAAIAFKIVSVVKELENVIGIFAALAALWDMIQVLLKLGLGIPCGGSGGSCDSCGDAEDICPTAIQNTSIDGTDGFMTVIYGSNVYDFDLRFYSSAQRNDFLSIRNFFPRGLDYDEINLEDVPYLLKIDADSFAVTGVDSSGSLRLYQTPAPQLFDGYLSTIINKINVGNDTDDIRFGTDTASFDSSMIYGNYYLEISDQRPVSAFPNAMNNNGTWKIKTILDEKNVILTRDHDTYGDWDGYALYNPGRHIAWRFAPMVPNYMGVQKSFSVEINHDELIRHDLIGLGCHPAIKAEKDALNNRFPDYKFNATLPELPDLDAVINDLTQCVRNVFPASIDSQWVLDNYGSIQANIGNLQSCVEDQLENFQDELIDYVKDIYKRVIDFENSTLSADPSIQIIGYNININVIPLDDNGARIALGLPPGTIDVEISATEGTLSSTTEILDAYGATTGVFEATLTSDVATSSTISATIDGYDVADFDGYDLVPRTITVEFVEPSDYRIRPEGGSVEPLGVGSTD